MRPNDFKTCASCGRRFGWRRRWRRCWNQVRYCSDACRRSRPDATDRALEDAILGMLACRHVGATICPSEPARVVAADGDWRRLVERSRRAARRLVERGRLEIVQLGRVVDPSTAAGPIRLRLPGGVTALRRATAA